MTAESTALDREVEGAVAFVLRSTRARPQTEAELADKLRGRQTPEGIIGTALDRARQLGAVDDVAFASAWVEDRGRERGYGRARLREELARRRVPEGLIEEALERLADRDEEAAATELAQRRFGAMPSSLTPDRAARRLAGFLARRGYGPGLAQRVAVRVTGLDREWD